MCDLSDSLSYCGRVAGPEPSVEDDAARRIAAMDAIGVASSALAELLENHLGVLAKARRRSRGIGEPVQW